MRLQKYNLQVMYKKGNELKIADTLSRAILPEVNASEFIREVEGADHRDGMVVTKQRWQLSSKRTPQLTILCSGSY